MGYYKHRYLLAQSSEGAETHDFPVTASTLSAPFLVSNSFLQ